MIVLWNLWVKPYILETIKIDKKIRKIHYLFFSYFFFWWRIIDLIFNSTLLSIDFNVPLYLFLSWSSVLPLNWITSSFHFLPSSLIIFINSKSSSFVYSLCSIPSLRWKKYLYLSLFVLKLMKSEEWFWRIKDWMSFHDDPKFS